MSPVALYIQLAHLLAKQIEDGKFKPRQPVPAAVCLLRERDLVVTLPGRGSYVAERKP
ncbi:GntR family transcriptional regulator [Micromonospora tulbaghiae]|nr:GntR family transcriptional regulator [Micromonospora tulbaghiae]